MRVEVRLFASLRDKLPPGSRGRADLELPDGSTVSDLVAHFEIERRLAQMVLVNGVQISRRPEDRCAHTLREGDTVSIFPPVAGG